MSLIVVWTVLSATLCSVRLMKLLPTLYPYVVFSVLYHDAYS